MSRGKGDGRVAVIDPSVTAIATAVENGDINTLKNTAAMASGLQKAAKQRGLGIADENKAAEVVVRAERGIGQVLLALPREPGGLNSDRVQLTPLQQALDSLGMLGAGGTGKGPNATAQRFMQLARLDEDAFEALIAARKEADERIAKVDFYRLAAPPVEKSEREKALEVGGLGANQRTDPLFNQFRFAARALLGVTVDDGGNDVYPERPFSELHYDDLVEAAKLIQRLAAAYAEEKSARQRAA